VATPRFRFDPILVESNECTCPKCGGYKCPLSRICIKCSLNKRKVGTETFPPQQTTAVLTFIETESVKATAAVMRINEKTVEYHLANARKRIGVGSLYGLIKWAYRTGLVSCLIAAMLVGCRTPVAPPPPPTHVRKAVIPPTIPTMPPGEEQYAKLMANSKPQGVVALPVSPAGAGVTSGAGTYPFKAMIVISAVASNGYAFSHWFDGNTSNPRSFSVPKGITTLTAFFDLLPPPPATNYSVNLAWNPAPSTNISGYNIYYGPASATYTNHIHVGNVTNGAVANLSGTQFFCVKSMGLTGLESICSNEVSSH